jgi:hypothetical protein
MGVSNNQRVMREPQGDLQPVSEEAASNDVGLTQEERDLLSSIIDDVLDMPIPSYEVDIDSFGGLPKLR